MTDEEKRVWRQIHAAFAGVALRDGVGLRQADGLDDYADSQKLAALRSQDEKHEWAAIPFEDLDRYYCSLSFFDSEGMRFHLPAYLVADLAGALHTADIVYHLTHFQYGMYSRFDMLSEAQRDAVIEFLFLRLADPSRAFEHPMIEAALEGFWLLK